MSKQSYPALRTGLLVVVVAVARPVVPVLDLEVFDPPFEFHF